VELGQEARGVSPAHECHEQSEGEQADLAHDMTARESVGTDPVGENCPIDESDEEEDAGGHRVDTI
jgi:hypothetical protein